MNLSKKHSYLVQKNFLYKIAINLGIEDLVLYDFKKKNKKMIFQFLSDTVESLIGAIYIDGGYKSSFLFIKNSGFSYLDIDVSKTLDPKQSYKRFHNKKEKTT